VIAVLTAAGCSSPYVSESSLDRGQTASEMVNRIESTDGISNAEFEYEEWALGSLFPTNGMNYRLSIDIEDGYVITQPVDFLRYAFQEAWTANEKSPKGEIYLEVRGGVSPNYLWHDAADDIFGEGVAYVDGTRITVGDEDMTNSFAGWPISPSTMPDHALQRGEVPVVLPVPLSDVRLGSAKLNGTPSVIFRATTNVSDDSIPYSGKAQLTIYYRSEVFETVALPSHNYAIREDFAYGNVMPDSDELSYKITFESQDGFDTTDIKGKAS
jgi:hypothetical protein